MNYNDEEDADLSIKELLIKYKLANEEGELLGSDSLPPADWGLGPYYWWECMIYLCTLIHFFREECMLENLEIAIEKGGERAKGNPDLYEIIIHEKDRRETNSFDWSIVLNTIEHLLPQMAGSNQTYLAGQLFYNT